MSELTDNSAHGINCELVEQRRKKFWIFEYGTSQYKRIRSEKRLWLFPVSALYQKWCDGEESIAKRGGLYFNIVADVLEKSSADSLEFRCIVTILLILVDQRYEISDMKYWVEGIKMLYQRGVKWYKLYCWKWKGIVHNVPLLKIY